ncbi:MAG TPA: hypothetical protein VFK50_10060 [Sphingomicrobium sp.]|nr:hypothetical protein [Sphingomicrobium sp.]
MTRLVNGGAEAARDTFALHCRGDVRLYLGDVDRTPKSKKGRALLAVLAAEQRALARVKIIDLLWSDRQEEQARASLRTLLADLKEQFGDRFEELLAVDRERVALGPAVRTDLTDPTLARPAGELFEGLDHIDPVLDEWLRVERAKWGEAHLPVAPLPLKPASRRRLHWLAPLVALACVVVIALAFVGGDRPRRLQTVAILPFDGAKSDGQILFGEYLAQAIRDTLRAEPQVRMLGEGSSRQIGPASHGSRSLKQLFGVDLVLSGTIATVGQKDRIVARLTDASSGSELWAAHYLVDASRRSSFRSRITRDLVQRIRDSLALPSSNANLSRWYEGAAGERLAEARRLILLNRPAEALEARRILLELVVSQPDNAVALAALGEATMAASDHPYVGGTLPTAQARQEARAYANRSIRLAPNLAGGYAALGASYMETAQAIAPLTRAVALEPGNYLHRTRLGRALEFEDRYELAYAQQLQAVRLEPIAALPMINLIRAANELNRHEDIQRHIAAFAARGPSARDLGYVRAYYAFLRDDNVGCVRNFGVVPVADINTQQRNVLLFCLTALGENGAALRLVADEDSLRRDVLVGDLDLLEGRVRKLGDDFWRRHYESLAAAERLVSGGRSRFLLRQFDSSYNSVEEFIREGGFLTLYPQPLLVAMRDSGRQADARKLRDLMERTVLSAKARPGGDQWESYAGASVAMADGDRRRAVRLLDRCAPTCIFTILQRDVSETALFRPLVGDVGFDDIIRRYRAMINRQRGQLGLSPLPLSSVRTSHS